MNDPCLDLIGFTCIQEISLVLDSLLAARKSLCGNDTKIEVKLYLGEQGGGRGEAGNGVGRGEAGEGVGEWPHTAPSKRTTLTHQAVRVRLKQTVYALS